jgi:hypothetical protein
VREFWFGKSLTDRCRPGEIASQALALNRPAPPLFESSPQLMGQQDELIRSKFRICGARARRTLVGDSPRRRLSLIILLDRTRDRFTVEPTGIYHDQLGLTLSGMQSAADGALNISLRLFFFYAAAARATTEVPDIISIGCSGL